MLEILVLLADSVLAIVLTVKGPRAAGRVGTGNSVKGPSAASRDGVVCSVAVPCAASSGSGGSVVDPCAVRGLHDGRGSASREFISSAAAVMILLVKVLMVVVLLVGNLLIVLLRS